MPKFKNIKGLLKSFDDCDFAGYHECELKRIDSEIDKLLLERNEHETILHDYHLFKTILTASTKPEEELKGDFKLPQEPKINPKIMEEVERDLELMREETPELSSTPESELEPIIEEPQGQSNGVALLKMQNSIKRKVDEDNKELTNKSKVDFESLKPEVKKRVLELEKTIQKHPNITAIDLRLKLGYGQGVTDSRFNADMYILRQLNVGRLVTVRHQLRPADTRYFFENLRKQIITSDGESIYEAPAEGERAFFSMESFPKVTEDSGFLKGSKL